MKIYSVSCTVSKEIADDWKNFFLEKHLDDVLNTGYFSSWKFRKVISNDTDTTVTFISEYFYENQEALDLYNKKFAPQLKAEVNGLFGGKYTCKRMLLEEINR